ncbi:MAG: hypothetical protein QUS11_08300 [Candidatus Fermentibacter sp.]|nr:hypothetical protein [Candidatus Fermentibacter sp.]
MRNTAVLLAVLPVALHAGSFRLSRDTLEIPVGQFRWIGFTVDIEQQEETRIEGFLTVVPDSSSIELILMHRDDFHRWSAGGTDVDTLYRSVTGGGEVMIPIDGFGDMVLVISNRGNYAPASLSASLDLAFEGSGVRYSPILTGSRIVLIMVATGMTAALLIGIASREAARRRRRRMASGRVDGRD